jgi:hypothetical protein
MTQDALEFLKAGLNLAVAVTTLGLTWFVGARFTTGWNVRQKRKESDLAAAQEFYRLYGEFFAIWQLWNYSVSHDNGKDRLALLQRASNAEGGIESLLVRLAASRKMSPEDIRGCACFRQGYQSLRQAITANASVDWHSSEHPEYLAFKRLAMYFALSVVADSSPSPKTAKARADALIAITSNEWEYRCSDRIA